MLHTTTTTLDTVVFSSSIQKAQDELLWLLAVRRPYVVRRPSTPLKDFSSETPRPIFLNHVEPSVKGGSKIYTNGYGPFIIMAAMPKYGKH